MAKKTIKAKSVQPKTVIYTKKDKSRLPKLSLFFFDRPRLTAVLFALILLFGIVSYTTLLKREGFPSINIPVASVSGAYFVNDANKVDQDVASPITKIALEQPGVAKVQTNSFPNFFNIIVQYDDSVDSQAASKSLEQSIKDSSTVPQQAQIKVTAPYFSPIGITNRPLDAGISFFAENNQNTKDIAANAEKFAEALRQKNLNLVNDVYVLNPFEEAQNPITGQLATVQKTFDKFGHVVTTNEESKNQFYNSVIIGVAMVPGGDLLKFDNQVQTATKEIAAQPEFNEYGATVSASYAPSIQENISELQRELIIALIAVLIIGSIVIAIRASAITVLSLILVIFAVIGLLYLFGYTLNVITLFALILSLALLVDDTIIMTEAIDAQRKKQHRARVAIEEATKKISSAMLSATLVAVLSFAPLLFAGGTLGNFIRAIPVTVILALLVSLLVSLVFIPFFAKYLLLSKKAMGPSGTKELSAGFEHKIAKAIAAPMRWAKGSHKRLVGVCLTAIAISLLFIGFGGYFGTKVAFNIFPPAKDANDIVVTLTFPNGTNLNKSQAYADEANNVIGKVVGTNFEQASLNNSGTEQGATNQIHLISYNDRKERAPEIVASLQSALDVALPEVSSKVSQQDAGPPPQAFVVAIETTDTTKGYALAQAVANNLNDATLTRPSGTTAKVTNVKISDPTQISRVDNNQRITVTVEFDSNDTSTLFNLAEAQVNKEFTAEKIEQFGLQKDVISFDLGQESENQDSFANLAIAFPVLLLVIYFLLAFQFKSLFQPLIIFMALPFSLFGITLSLYLSDNPFSFFAMLGFFALIGLSIKNTILLTDYANQERRTGKGAVDSMISALNERFRPLLATSVTAVVALVPLSIISPFWQGLAILIIFGLLSSTFLVITVFPYYYLAGEWVRSKISRKVGLSIVGVFVLVAVLASFVL
ncbi:MAG: Efflux transporter permease subunit [Patescibacteria group bacterium]|nr:Efflux transporter permease subunit [Patescibacteria group bacterium]